ncbi:arsenate reductase (glutaredoxin) [Noviherbaspirillum cavernae]|uniref:Arsenate reductase n=1 Tax=Noviherbaspirillum cavernae TaxID=2320862 RepID=A0A418X4I4_9BURK|nr:arsenate reductase (glutaredoxin) [Noviherbaspirillum cavernae]RJG07350.1 arsenate reductase (glutaredoxin) [Noviherbaspirillum cavernae]
MITIYHNPGCSKSREALTMVQQFAEERNLTLQIVEYLKTPPSLAQLVLLHELLGIPVRDMVRDNEAAFAELGLANADDAALLRAVSAHPRLLQRPIVSYRGRAMIGRPPERLSGFLSAD